MAVRTGLPTEVTLFLAGLAAFWLPGYGWAAWLHRREGFPWPTRAVLGFAWSFAVFTLVGDPFLWFHGRATDFRHTLGVVWAVFALVAAWTYLRGRRAPVPVGRAHPSWQEPGPTRGPSIRPPRLAGAAVALVLYAAVAGGLVGAWAVRKDHLDVLIRVLPLGVLAGAGLAWLLRRHAGSLLAPAASDATPPPRAWTLTAVALVAAQAVSTVVYYRPDWDDCLTLAAARDYTEGEILNDEEPTHRQGFPLVAVESLLSWELWGATLGRFAGLGPLVVFHTLLPPLLVGLAYASYAALFGELLPRRWVPLALVGLSGYFLFGISGLECSANHFLVRIWQGKAVLLHVALPLVAVMTHRFAARPVVGRWLGLTASVVFAAGVSTSATFLGGVLVAALTVALLPVARGRRSIILAGSALAVAPLLVPALTVRDYVLAERVMHQAGAASAWHAWFATLLVHAGRGSVEILWVVLLPLVAALLPGPRGRGLLVIYPALVLATVANPWLRPLVAGRLTTDMGYYRLFWLFPVGAGLASATALLARLAERWLHRKSPRPSAQFALGAALALATLAGFLPGRYVWSPANDVGPFMTPRRAENPEKMPADVLAIARLLARDPDRGAGTVLAPEEVAAFLTPYSRDFRMVFTRPGYTTGYLTRAGRPREAVERYFLGEIVKRFALMPRLGEEDWKFLAGYLGKDTAGEYAASPSQPEFPRDFARLLDRYGVHFAVTMPPLQIERPTAAETAACRMVFRESMTAAFRDAGFQAVFRGREGYILWKRDTVPGLRPPAGRRSSETAERHAEGVPGAR